MEFIARDAARRACSAVVREKDRRELCIELLTRILAYGTRDREAIEEMKKGFTEEERRRLREELERLLA